MSSTLAPRPVSFGTSGSAASGPSLSPGEQKATWIALVSSLFVLMLVYWNELTVTKDYWSDDTYSHGWIIPFFAMFLMWSKRQPLDGPVSKETENKILMAIFIPAGLAVASYLFLDIPAITWSLYATSVMIGLALVFRYHEFEPVEMYERWIGAVLVIGSLSLRLYGTYYDKLYWDRFSLIPAMLGVFMLAGGFPIIKRMWASIAFFAFMMPLPSKVEHFLLGGLQKIAAAASTTVLQILGVGAYRQGSRINVDGLAEALEVIGACAGLRMLTIFCAMVIAMVLLIERPWWDKLILLLSAIPIALVTNIIRITVTALLYLAVEGSPNQEMYHQWIHDYAGFAMIIIAAGIMLFEYKILSWLFVEEGDEVLHTAGMRGGMPIGRN
ncbi:exosortase/archaeosortase family protein [Aeoliella sp. ICT_H6.2]|uniref:Exosortase/archaeosortase family protein n=1 Tax=Aeoliella straminimaris TaxID=2954799 RepID=A0A9X2JEL2_9BACT|nr:exosortase/archaeosortase family protein [Aeoliella straminimaris]MCO6043135.1 exosortase/archaeosortase family protein [Aeoliella straminimaris]